MIEPLELFELTRFKTFKIAVDSLDSYLLRNEEQGLSLSPERVGHD